MVTTITAMTAPPCWACTCPAPIDQSDYAKHADVVFTGRLKSVEELGEGKSFKMRFLLGKVYKGSAKRFTNVFAPDWAGQCGYPNKLGKRYTVFANLDDGKKYTSNCSGTKQGTINPDNFDLGDPYPPKSDQ